MSRGEVEGECERNGSGVITRRPFSSSVRQNRDLGDRKVYLRCGSGREKKCEAIVVKK